MEGDTVVCACNSGTSSTAAHLYNCTIIHTIEPTVCECLFRTYFQLHLCKDDIIPVGTENAVIVGVLADLHARLCQHIVSVPIPLPLGSEGLHI